MERLLLECTVRAALLVVIVSILLYGMRVKGAATKHSVWSGVLVLMLLLPAWTAWGPRVSLPLLPALPAIAANQVPLNANHSAAPVSTPFLTSRPIFFLAIYLCGFLYFAARLAAGTVRACRLISNATQLDGILTSSACAAPITVGFFHPVAILPEQWREWPRPELEAVLAHEGEHVRRRDSLLQWLALLNRALFWFHPAAWWLEHSLSTLAEEACDDVVVSRGHQPSDYAECLLEMARRVGRAGTRVDVSGMAMPGGSLARRVRRILEDRPRAEISRTRMATVLTACAVACSVVTASTIGRAHAVAIPVSVIQSTNSSNAPTKFVLGDLKLDGNIHDRDAVTNRILAQWKDREYKDANELATAVAEFGIRGDLQNRGYFTVLVRQPSVQLLVLSEGKQRVLVTIPIVEGDLYKLKNMAFQNSVANQALAIPNAILREQFHIHDSEVFNVSEIQAGMERVMQLYKARGNHDSNIQPNTQLDDANHTIKLIMQVIEGSSR